MMKHPRLSSEKNITTTLGYEMGVIKSRREKNVFIAGFQLLEPISLGKWEIPQNATCGGESKTSLGLKNVR